MKQPMQPIKYDDNGVIRFQPNLIVRFLLDWASSRGMSLNELAIIPFPKEDREQFSQLIGYSVSGYGDLSYVSEKSLKEADRKAEKLRENRD